LFTLTVMENFCPLVIFLGIATPITRFGSSVSFNVVVVSNVVGTVVVSRVLVVVGIVLVVVRIVLVVEGRVVSVIFVSFRVLFWFNALFKV